MNSLNQLSNVVSTSRFMNSAARALVDEPAHEARGYFQRRQAASAQAAAAAPVPADPVNARPGLPLLPQRRGSTAEAAQILGCSTSLVRWLIATGELMNVERPGKRQYLLDLDEVHRYRLKKMEDRF